MGTIAEKLNKLLGTKAAIKAAIIEKGQEVGDVFSEYPDKIRAIESGLDTSDADASASDICRYKTAYVNGKKITGNVTEVAAKDVTTSNFDEIYQDNEYVGVDGTYDEDKLFRVGSYVKVLVPLTSFGNATAADVASGKTFTSSDGLLVEGTATSSSSPIVSCTVTNNTGKSINVYTDCDNNIEAYGDGGSISIDCTSGGALFIVASASNCNYSNLSGMQYVTYLGYGHWHGIFKVTATSGTPSVTIG